MHFLSRLCLLNDHPSRFFFIFGNQKKSHELKSDEYGDWGSIMTVLFLAKKSRTSSEVYNAGFVQNSTISKRIFPMFHTQNVGENCTTRANWYANIIWNVSVNNLASIQNHFSHCHTSSLDVDVLNTCNVHDNLGNTYTIRIWISKTTLALLIIYSQNAT